MKYPVIQNSSAKTTALNESFLLHGFTPSALSIPMFIAALEIRILQSLKGCIQFVLHRVSINVRRVSDRPSPCSRVRRRILDLRSSRRTLCSPIPCISIAFLLFSPPLYVGSSRVTREEKKRFQSSIHAPDIRINNSVRFVTVPAHKRKKHDRNGREKLAEF